MNLPIIYIIDYEPIDFHNMSFESGLRHIPSYANLLTDIEHESAELVTLLSTLRKQVPGQLLDEWNTVYNDYLYFHDLLTTCKTRDISEYARDMMNHTLEHLDHFEDLIRNAVDQNLLAQCNDKYFTLLCLTDEKYNEHDKWYYD